jgi:hypothetical protein
MKALCTHKCFFRGRSIKPGEVIEITEAEAKTGIVGSSFATEFDPTQAAPVKPDNGLTAENLRLRLTEMGIAFKARDDKATLEKLYTDALAAKTAKPE